MADEKNDRYLDENLTDEEKEGGRSRPPIPQEGTGTGPDTKLDTLNPDRPDEFGDGDRRS